MLRPCLDTNYTNFHELIISIANWYFWALKIARFPKDAPKEADGHDHIRLITRLIFGWFVKEKGLIPGELFDEKGLARTLSGVTLNTELNVLVQGNDNHAELGKWFDELWKESQDFDEALMQEMKQSWAVAAVRPYDVYMKTLYALVRDRLKGEDDKDILWDDEITAHR